MDSVKLLSGEELVANGAKKGSVGLPIKGLKQTISQDTPLENEEIENNLQNKKTLLEDQRIEKRSTLSFAEWDDILQKAVVIEKKGPHWLHIGHAHGNKIYIYPEEALYLMEIGALLLKYKKITVSIQQAYSLLLGKSIKLDEYRVYSLLSREGYRLIRHNISKYLKSTTKLESNRSIDKKTLKNVDSMNNDEINIENISKHPDENVLNIQSTSNGTKITSLIERSFPVSSDSDGLMKNSIEKIELLPRKRKICDISEDTSELSNSSSHNVKRKAIDLHENIFIENFLPRFDRMKILDSIVDCFRKKTVCVLAPYKQLVPKNIFLNKKKYFINIDNLILNHRNISPDEVFDFENSENVSKITQSLNKNFDPKKRNFDNLTYDNQFITNTPFYNHIYREISINQFKDNFNFNKPTAFSNSNNDNKSLLCDQSSIKLYRPHSYDQNQTRPFVGNITQSNVSSSTSHSIPDEITCNMVPNKIENNDKYSELLHKMKTFLSDFNINDLQNEHRRKTLSDFIKKYNNYFDSNFVLNDDNRMIAEPIAEILNDPTLLSSKTESLNMNVDTTTSEHSISEFDSSNTIHEPEIDLNDDNKFTNIPNQSSDCGMIYENMNMQNWFKRDEWIISPKKTNLFKSNSLFKTLAETNAFLNSMKIFSHDKESNILCWKQAKLFFLRVFAKETTAFTFGHSSSSHNNLLCESFVEIDNIKPLIRPQDCKNVLSVLNKLQIVGTNFNSSNTFNKDDIDIQFDVYLPTQKSFKKSSPNYCLIVWSSSSKLPSPKKLDLLRSRIPNNIKILFAIMSYDAIFFLEMGNIQLPMLDESCNK